MTTRCAVVGATGLAGQQFLAALYNHPFLQVTVLAASKRSAGKAYKDAIRQASGQMGWYVDDEAALEHFGDMTVVEAAEMDLTDIDLVFSAVESEPARELESRFAKEVPVVSTASAYRYEKDVPVLIPAVNGDQADLIHAQKKARGWNGFVVPIPNCTTTGLAIALAPLHAAFGIAKVVMTSMQATSGAGRSPGVISLDIVDNIIPYIPKEEEKVELETRKLLGELKGEQIEDADFRVSATCTRVAVMDAHTETVTVALKKPASVDEVKAAMRAFGAAINPKTHPSAPEHWLRVSEDPFRPQPKRDRGAEDGMSTTVGRVRPDDVLGEHGVKFVLVSHNTKMGAAKGAVLVAEDLKVRGFIA